MSRRAVLIEALEATPRDLARMLRRVGNEAALVRDPSGWCIAAVVAEMVVAEQAFRAMFQRAVAEDGPVIEGMRPDPDSHELVLSPHELAERFAEQRAGTIAFLGGLEQAQWARWLVVVPGGPIRLREQVQALVTHDNERLGQLVALRG